MSSVLSRRIAAILVACASGVLVRPAFAQDAATTPATRAEMLPDAKPRDFEAVIVIASAPRAPLSWVTDPKLPRQPVPASDGADFLKTIPGFSTIRNGGTNGDPVLRGMFGSRLALLSNDSSLLGACPARMDNPVSYIAPETFDQLSIIKGPQTVRWGPGASAGTIRFERDLPHFDEPGSKLAASALAGANGRNDQVLDATLGTPRGYVRMDGNRSESGDYRDGSGRLVPSRWRKWSGDVALGWTPDADTVLELNAGRGDALARYAGRGMDGISFARRSVGARFEKSGFTGALQAIQASVYRNDADHLMDNYTLRMPNPMSSMPMPMAANVDRTTEGGRVALDWRMGKLDLSTGVDGQVSRHRGRSASGRDAYLAKAWTPDARMDDLGVFAEATFGKATARRWLGGVRVDRARATDQRLTTGMMAMPNPTAGRTRSERLVSSFLRYELDPAPDWRSYAGLGHSQRMPDYWELFSASAGPMGSVNAFAALRPERTTQFDAGLQYRSERHSAWLSAYAGRVEDFILFTYSTGGMMGSSTRVTNVDARIAGAEAGWSWRPALAWKLEATFAYAWGENSSDGKPLPQMPPLELRLGAEWRRRDWSVGALWRGAARQGRVDAGKGNVVGRDLGPSVGFATFAVNGGYRLSDTLQLTVGVDNLFDRDYSEHLNLAGSADFGWPADPVRIHEPGRTWWLKLGYRR